QEILREDSYTSKFIHMTVPDPSDFGKMCLAFASDEIARLLIRQTQLEDNVKVIRFLDSTANYSDAGGIRGKLFELFAHERLQKGGVYEIRHLENAKNATPATTTRVTYPAWELNEYTDNNIKKGVYNLPLSKNNETVDSLVLDEHNRDAFLFQMTVNEHHGAKVNGLKSLESFLSNYERISLIYVVPRDKFDKYPWQSYRTTAGKTFKKWNTTNRWIKDINQFVLKMELSEAPKRQNDKEITNNDNNKHVKT
ncbi:4985_t:CDS:2, partial [Paraglomus brasilianum]